MTPLVQSKLNSSMAAQTPEMLSEYYEQERKLSHQQSEINEEAIKALFHDPRAKQLDPERHPREELEPEYAVDATPTLSSALDDTGLTGFYEQERKSSRRQSEINEEAIKAAARHRTCLRTPHLASPLASALRLKRRKARLAWTAQALFHDPRAKQLDPERPDPAPRGDAPSGLATVRAGIARITPVE